MDRKCIKSYAFFDLETTGLPAEEFNRTKVTEICLVATSKDHILHTGKNHLPRILNKLSFCINPVRQISSVSTRITGLDNSMLENENRFDENFAKLLNQFLLQLPQPVCLVAHNGYGFDFPIIQKELKSLNATLPNDILCIDSLPFFRWYEDLLLQEKLDEPKPLPDEEQSENGSKATIPENVTTDKQTTPIPATPTEEPCTSVKSSDADELQNVTVHPSTPADVVDINVALSAEDTKQKQMINESTPSNRKTVVKKEMFSKRMLNNGNGSVTPLSKRQLFTPPNSGSSAASPSKRMKFTMIAVHERFFGHEPSQSHYAENDVLTLLKCVVASKSEFVEYAETHAKPFSDIKAIGM